MESISPAARTRQATGGRRKGPLGDAVAWRRTRDRRSSRRDPRLPGHDGAALTSRSPSSSTSRAAIEDASKPHQPCPGRSGARRRQRGKRPLRGSVRRRRDRRHRTRGSPHPGRGSPRPAARERCLPSLDLVDRLAQRAIAGLDFPFLADGAGGAQLPVRFLDGRRRATRCPIRGSRSSCTLRRASCRCADTSSVEPLASHRRQRLPRSRCGCGRDRAAWGRRSPPSAAALPPPMASRRRRRDTPATPCAPSAGGAAARARARG